MISVIKTNHELKCQVFKNNYWRLRDGFRSSGFIKGFLYSKGIINAETRDAHDVEKVLGDVEFKLKFTETTWEVLLSGMSEPPLDGLCSELKRELEIELSKDQVKITESYKHTTLYNPPIAPTSLPIPDELKNKMTKDSGCGSTDYRNNYPTDYFPIPSGGDSNDPPLTTPTNSTRPYNSISSYFSTSSTDSTDYTACKQPYTESSIDSGAATFTDSISDILSPISADNMDYSDKSPCRNSSNDSGYENSQIRPPVPASTPIASELVNSLQKNRTTAETTAGSSSSSHVINTENRASVEAEITINKRVENLEKENDNLRHDKKRLVDQLKEFEEDNNYLMEKRKDDQQLLEYKMIQVARENEILERKQENIRRLESENRELKKGIKSSLIEQDLLMKRNEELMFRIQLAERSTSLSAITIDQLKQGIASQNTVIDQLREELSQYRDWYTTLASCNSANGKESSTDD